MTTPTIARLAVLLLGIGLAARAQAQFGLGGDGGGYRGPGYGNPGGGASPLGTYGELGDRSYGAAAGNPVDVRPPTREEQAPVGSDTGGDLGAHIPVPGGVGTDDMVAAGAATDAPPGDGAQANAPVSADPSIPVPSTPPGSPR